MKDNQIKVRGRLGALYAPIYLKTVRIKAFNVKSIPVASESVTEQINVRVAGNINWDAHDCTDGMCTHME